MAKTGLQVISLERIRNPENMTSVFSMSSVIRANSGLQDSVMAILCQYQKRGGVNLEFSLSAGYAKINYRGYLPSEDYSILWRDLNNKGKLYYVGPTKVQISLVVPIRKTHKKGGA